jgi:hypothetical protein
VEPSPSWYSDLHAQKQRRAFGYVELHPAIYRLLHHALPQILLVSAVSYLFVHLPLISSCLPHAPVLLCTQLFANTPSIMCGPSCVWLFGYSQTYFLTCDLHALHFSCSAHRAGDNPRVLNLVPGCLNDLYRPFTNWACSLTGTLFIGNGWNLRGTHEDGYRRLQL